MGIAFAVGAIGGAVGYSLSYFLTPNSTFTCGGFTNAILFGGASGLVTVTISFLVPIFFPTIATAAGYLGFSVGIADQAGLTNEVVKILDEKYGVNIGDSICSYFVEHPTAILFVVLGPSSLPYTLLHDDLVKIIDPFIQDLATKIETKTKILPDNDPELVITFPIDFSKQCKDKILFAVNFKKSVYPESVEYVSFEYSLDKVNWLPVRGFVGNTPLTHYDTDPSDGWFVMFATGKDGVDIKQTSSLWLRSQAKLKNGKISPWVITSQALSVKNVFDHDYEILNVSVSQPEIFANDVVTVTGKLSNSGTSTESSGVPVDFIVDGKSENTTTTIPQLTSGATFDVKFSWIAKPGAHNLKIKSNLATDIQTSNDSKEIPINVGTKGELIVDGSFAPVKSYSLKSNSSNSYKILLQNSGTAKISVAVSKSGQVDPWITLTSGTVRQIDPGNSFPYEFMISVPNNTSPNGYTGLLLFTYGDNKSVTATLNINIVNFANGVAEIALATSVSIDGTWQQTRMMSFPEPNLNQFYLDNDPATSTVNYKQEFQDNLTTDDFYRINSAIWKITADEQQSNSSSSGIYMAIKEGAKSNKSYTSDVNNQTIDILTWLQSGINSYYLGLNNVGTTAADTKWWINNTQVFLYYSKAGWGTSLSVSPSDLTKWKDNWIRARIYFDVTSVSTPGKLHLYNMEQDVSVIDISSTGNQKYISVPKSSLTSENKFVLRGDYDAKTKVQLANLKLKVEFYTGDPLIECTKTVSLEKTNVTDTVNVTLKLSNNGSNKALLINYADSLPIGINLVSSSLSGSVDQMIPTDSMVKEYRISSTAPGIYTLYGTPVNYQNSTGNKFQSSFNSVSLFVSGGALKMNGKIDTTFCYLNDTISLTAKVMSVLTRNDISNAIVAAKVIKPNHNIDSANLIYDGMHSQYVYAYTNTSLIGEYQVLMKATNQFYDSDSFTVPLTFRVDRINNAEKDPTQIPLTYTLYQNYPNPFNPTAVIEFQIPKDDYVTITLFDILGRKIKTLFKDNISTGKYSINLNGSDLSSGIYFYVMNSSHYHSIKKMILMK